MLKGGSQNRWGNNVGYVLFPIPLNHHTDALDHVRAAKKISDRKKNSLEAIFTYWAASLLMYISGPKVRVKIQISVLHATWFLTTLFSRLLVWATSRELQERVQTVLIA